MRAGLWIGALNHRAPLPRAGKMANVASPFHLGGAGRESPPCR